MDVLLVGYGTLLLKGSLGHTIGTGAASGKRVRPVVVRGYRRLFNLRPTHYPSSQKLSRESIENAAMNVELAEPAHFNALAFPVTERELQALDLRERYYERRHVPMEDFETGALLGEGHCYVADPEAKWIERNPDKLLPLWRDVVWARTGAYRISESFGRDYDSTTYLADGKTLVVDRYQGLIADMSDVEIPE